MQKTITEIDIKKSSNAKRCQMILEIIKGQAVYRDRSESKWIK